MKNNRGIALIVVFLLSLGIQLKGSFYALSTGLAVPDNIAVRTSTNASYQNASVTVSWDYVSGATAYAILATRAGTSTTASTAVSGEKNNQVILSGLIGGASYVVQVRTVQDQSVSAWSSNSLIVIPTTLPKAPEKPSVLSGVGSATVSWTALTGLEDGGSPVTSYVVTESNSGKSVSASPSETSITIDGLTQGAKAVFRVAAITQVSSAGATSAASDEITILSDGVVSPTPDPTASSSAAPTAPAEVVPSASSAPNNPGVGSSGGFVGGLGGGFALPAIPTPSPSPTATPSPSSSSITKGTPLEPLLTPAPTPTPKITVIVTPKPTVGPATNTGTRNFLEVVKSSAKDQIVPISTKSVSVSASKNFALLLPVQSKGSKITVSIVTPTGQQLNLYSAITRNSGSVKLPSLDLKKTGSYKVMITINGKKSTLKLIVKR